MKTQQRKREIVMKGLLSLAVVVALAGGASAAIVAQHDGPTDFEGSTPATSPAVDWVTLADVPLPAIGDEGTLEVEFKVDAFPDPSSWANTSYLWSYHKSDGNGLHRVFFGQEGPTSPTMMLKVFLKAPEAAGYAVAEQIPFNDTFDWHTLQVTWKNDEETLITLDGTVHHVTNNSEYPLVDFSNDEGKHLLGTYNKTSDLYDGMMRNVKVYDTYASGPGPDPIPGDANLDDIVNDADASILAAHWQQTGMGWGDGDFNNDQIVNDADASILAAHWQESQEGTAPVPEPGSVILLIGAALSLLAWRLRCR